MAKAVISNRIYIDNPGEEVTKEIMKALTYKFKRNTGKTSFNMVDTVKNYKILQNGIVSMPQGRVDLIPEHYEVLDKRVVVPAPYPTPAYPLYPEQQLIFDQVQDTCFINALVGWGKSATALHIARKLGQKTLVITHTAALRDQWVEEVEKLYRIPVGIIGGGKLDYEDHVITISNTQTLIKHYGKLTKEFGCVILDEAHHTPANTFTTIIDSFYARYRIALSGTMIRKDEKHVIFGDYFGSTVLKPPQSNTMTPTIRLVRTGLTLLPNGSWTEKISDLCENDSYQRFIAAVALLEMEVGHKVLIVADRVDFLKKVCEYVGDDCVLVTGDTEFEERQLAKQEIYNGTKSCIAGSRQIFAEGISINPLSCIILTIPIGDNESLLEQLIGRVQRMHEGKLNPLVLDMQFSGWADKAQNNARLGFYLRKGWKVETT